MPIVGYTDAAATFFGDGLPLIGKIRKGDEKPENKPGKDLDHFRVVFEAQFEHLMPEWERIYGPEPREFGMVYLFGDELDEVFSSWMEEWGASETLYHRCDSQHQVKKWSAEARQYLTSRNGGMPCESNQGCQCKPVGRLDIVLRDFTEQTGVLGHFLVETHSMHDIIYIHGFLKHLKRTMKVESYRGLPFKFGRAPRVISVPKQKKVGNRYELTGERMRKEMSLLYLLLEEQYMQLEYLPVVDERPQLPSTITVVPTESSADPEKARAAFGGGNGKRIMRDAPELDEEEAEIIDHETSDQQPAMNKPSFDWSVVYNGVGDLLPNMQAVHSAVQQMLDDQDIHAGMIENAVVQALVERYAPQGQTI